MKRLLGKVATVVAPQSLEDRRAAVVTAAVAYVQAWTTWQERGGFAPRERQILHDKQRALTTAVEGLGAAERGLASISDTRSEQTV